MLSKKINRVTVFTTASALLLCPCLAAAVAIKLDGEGRDAPKPLVYAVETLGASTPVDETKAYHLTSPGGSGSEELKLAVSPKRRIPGREDVFLRLRLHRGLVFRADASPSLEVVNTNTGTAYADTGVNFDNRIFGGALGNDTVVFKLRPPSFGIVSSDRIVIDLTNDLAIIGGVGTYAAEISAHTNPDDAVTGVGARSTIFGARADIVRVTAGVEVFIFPISPAVADVATGYLRFIRRYAAQPLSGQAKLGWVRVAPKKLGDEEQLLHAATGEQVVTADLITDGGVNIQVEGDLSIGAFHIIGDFINVLGLRSEPCPGADASAENPDRGSLMDDADDFLVSESGEVSSTRSGWSGGLNAHEVLDFRVYSLCVNVDVLGRETNSKPIPNAKYVGTVSLTGTATGAEPAEAATGFIGRIRRNGTAVKIPYLTASAKYDQKLIIINRGTTPAFFVLGEFAAEPGTTVELSANAEAARRARLDQVPPFGQLVLAVSDLLKFSGKGKRASATLGLNAYAGDIQVATVQTNLLDGGTDMVVYPPIPDPEL